MVASDASIILISIIAERLGISQIQVSYEISSIIHRRENSKELHLSVKEFEIIPTELSKICSFTTEEFIKADKDYLVNFLNNCNKFNEFIDRYKYYLDITAEINLYNKKPKYLFCDYLGRKFSNITIDKNTVIYQHSLIKHPELTGLFVKVLINMQNLIDTYNVGGNDYLQTVDLSSGTSIKLDGTNYIIFKGTRYLDSSSVIKNFIVIREDNNKIELSSADRVVTKYKFIE